MPVCANVQTRKLRKRTIFTVRSLVCSRNAYGQIKVLGVRNSASSGLVAEHYFPSTGLEFR